MVEARRQGKKKKWGRVKKASRMFLVAGFLATMALPPALVAASGTATASITWTVVRIAALESFTLIFWNIITGSLSRYFCRLFQAEQVRRFHIISGVSGFFLALTHGAVVLIEKFFVGFSPLWIIGPIALLLLFATIGSAILRERFSKTWRRIHQLNYLIFLAIFIKGILIGSDLYAPTGTALILRVTFSAYVVVAALATAVRARDLLRLSKKQRERSRASWK